MLSNDYYFKSIDSFFDKNISRIILSAQNYFKESNFDLAYLRGKQEISKYVGWTSNKEYNNKKNIYMDSGSFNIVIDHLVQELNKIN